MKLVKIRSVVVMADMLVLPWCACITVACRLGKHAEAKPGVSEWRLGQVRGEELGLYQNFVSSFSCATIYGE